MWNLRNRAAPPVVSVMALATVALSLTLYSPPAACEEEATGPEESETDASSGSPKQDAQEPREAAAVPPKTRPKTPDCRSKSTEEARIIRQQGTVSGPGCENATNTESHRNAEVTATIGATALTGAFGFGSTWLLASSVCWTSVIISGNPGSECEKGFLGYGILGGIGFGFMGYKNQPLYIIFSSSASLLFAGGMLGASMDSDNVGFSMGLLGGVGGAYLGYRLWRVRQPTGPLNLFKTPKSIWSRASVSPYLNRERSGLVLSGLF
jgi:hypothetical protein